MRRLVLAALFLAIAASWQLTAKDPAVPPMNTVKLNGHVFTLPPGFEIELVAGPPLVDRPITADFDEQGRLYVADSSGSRENVREQLKKRPHRILRLEDTNGDGRFDRRTVFADKMMFPEGTMWFDGSLYVAAPPSIWKLTDTDGDGIADKRVEWFKGKTLTGCANDLHGPYLGPDGWVYWCKGAFAEQTYDRPGKKPFVTKAAHIFRCRPDGSGLEPVMTGGMDNPVDVVFTPGGERIFTTTFLQKPGGGRRDGLIHAVYGGVYGKEHRVIDGHKRTGPGLMPVLTHLGPAAPAGLVRYEGTAFGPEYRNNLFAALFNLRKVTRHVLVPNGATFTTRDEDFLVSDNHDFHPTDVVEDADGSLLVIDTGGWYKLCCPTSQLHKPDVLGAIYRIRRKGAPRPADPRGLKLAWAKMGPRELAALLDDARPAVRRRAVQALGGKGAAAVPVLAGVIRKGKSAEARRNAVWAATRIDGEPARAAVRSALTDKDETVRQAAAHSASVRRDRGALLRLLNLLLSRKASLQNRRVAAEAMGRLGNRLDVPALLVVAGETTDPVLEHAITYALIEIDDREATEVGLTSKKAGTRRAALVALDQMDGGKLEPRAVKAELASPDARLRETAWWVASCHPEWGGELAGFLRDRLAAKGLTPAERAELVQRLARFAGSAPVRDLLAERLRDRGAPRDVRITALRAMAAANLKEAPAAWTAALAEVLAARDAALVGEAVATARAIRLPKKGAEAVTTALLNIAADKATAVDVRLAALSAVLGGLAEVKPAVFTFLREHLDREQPVATRTLAADVLSRARLTREQLLALADALKNVGPMEVNRLLDAFVQSTDEDVGKRLVAALKAAPARSSLRAEALKPRLAKYPASVRARAEELYAALNVDAAKEKARLEELLTTLKGGDVRRGQAVFNSAKAACSSCHAVGYVGGHVGPDLTKIGSIRTERDLLEAVVFPSSSFARGYEPVEVVTASGKVHNGVLRRESPDEVVLATGADQEVRIRRKDIEEMRPSKVSVMPAGLDKQLSPRELADLVTFLRACR